MRNDVLIVGGGLAGLTAGVALAGAGRRVRLLEQKAHLFELIEEWANRLPSISELPAVVWDLRCHLADDLDDVGWLRPARNWTGRWG